jgi:acyl carrier protein
MQDDIAIQVLERLKRAAPQRTSFELQARLKEDLGLSSLKLVTILTQLCEQLQFDILALTDADLARLDRVSDLIDLFAGSRKGTTP